MTLDNNIKLGTEEIALLKKLGIKLPTKSNKRTQKDSPKLISLEGQSATVRIECNCCGNITTSYIDYIKRDDGSGYGVKYVSTPTSTPTREHQRTVIFCDRCKTDNLGNFSKDELTKMITNLRRHR